VNDEELIAMVAKAWVDGGGDAEGISWCWPRIKRAIEELIAAYRHGENE